MPSVFLVSDTHFGHAGVCRFTRDDGVTKLRPWDDPAEIIAGFFKSFKTLIILFNIPLFKPASEKKIFDK